VNKTMKIEFDDDVAAEIKNDPSAVAQIKACIQMTLKGAVAAAPRSDGIGHVIEFEKGGKVLALHVIKSKTVFVHRWPSDISGLPEIQRKMERDIECEREERAAKRARLRIVKS
jgi:hypothetical protein